MSVIITCALGRIDILNSTKSDCKLNYAFNKTLKIIPMTNPSVNNRHTAIILVIGNEILNGKTLDTNSRFLAHKLFVRGIDIIRRLTIPDIHDVIVEQVRKNSHNPDYKNELTFEGCNVERVDDATAKFKKKLKNL